MANTVIVCGKLFDGLGNTIRGSALAYGTDCGMFPFSEEILKFQTMLAPALLPRAR
jgi:hypothetical protein